jgi:hypothetical protein
MFILAIGVAIGANWPYVRALAQFSSFKEFLERVPIIGVLLTFAGLIYQRMRARFNLEIDLCVKVTDKWDGEHMRKQRANAARSLLIDRKAPSPSVDAVCDFIEDLGYLVQRGAISERSAWQYFAAIVMPYHEITLDYRRQYTADEAEVWMAFDRLYDKMVEQDRLACARNKLPSPLPWSKDDLDEYLAAESRVWDEKPARKYGNWRLPPSRSD